MDSAAGIMGCCEVETARAHFQRGINVCIFYKEGFRSSFSTKRDLYLCVLQQICRRSCVAKKANIHLKIYKYVSRNVTGGGRKVVEKWSQG